MRASRDRSIRLLVAALSILALVLSGCGSDEEGEPIPTAAVQALDKELDSIERRFEVGGGACEDISAGDENNVEGVQRVLDDLPRDVDADVRDALTESFDRLFQLTSEQCDDTAEQRTTPETTPEPAPTPTLPETTETQTEPERPEEPEQEEPENGQGKGKGKGEGKGKGNDDGGQGAGTGAGGAEAPQ